jgi:hypothetical protein
LETCLARAERTDEQDGDFIEIAYRLLDAATPEHGDIPSAAISWLGEGGDLADATWLHADPVYLKPDMDRLLLFDHRALRIERGEAEVLVDLINAHFAEDGWRVCLSASDRWYLRIPETPALRTRALYDVAGRNIYPFLPTGADQRRWRAWLNELQMLLYHAEPNRLRRDQNWPEINGLWLWGAGRVAGPVNGRWDCICGPSPFAKGLAQLSGARYLDHHTDALAQASGRCMILLDRLLYPLMDGDKDAWEKALGECEALFAGVLTRLRDRFLDVVWIYPCDGSRYRLTPSLLRRFWRRSKPLDFWLDRKV